MEITNGDVAVITGAGSGIGRALAQHAASLGMRVVASDVEPPTLDETVRLITEAGGTAIGVPTDVSVAESVQALADAAYATYGDVHLLCNNAGVFSGGLLWERTIADWNWVMGVNLYGIVHAISAFVPRMIAAGHAAQPALRRRIRHRLGQRRGRRVERRRLERADRAVPHQRAQ